MPRLSKDAREFNALSWRLIEWKVAYYLPERVHVSWGEAFTVSDEEYDRAEVRYLTLCRKLQRPNTVVHKEWPGFEDISLEHAMTEVDETRPSVQLVITKLSNRRPRARRRKPNV